MIYLAEGEHGSSFSEYYRQASKGVMELAEAVKEKAISSIGGNASTTIPDEDAERIPSEKEAGGFTSVQKAGSSVLGIMQSAMDSTVHATEAAYQGAVDLVRPPARGENEVAADGDKMSTAEYLARGYENVVNSATAAATSAWGSGNKEPLHKDDEPQSSEESK
eukprot:TRINITY_DN159595_c0_g1_i1.p1 TRINITY_DN159595_c0_g1~~TRINITY_DN159595_c0_g1_i1.p1  ORF type:complete len:164 (+),score=18.91 TRINITY_DN159595_c0_g1_i1:255-746(+)